MKNLLKIFPVLALSLLPCAEGFAQGSLPRPMKSNQAPKPRLIVNGQSDSVDINFPTYGGSINLSISTNQGIPKISSVPDWIFVRDISTKSMNVRCDANYSNLH